MAKRGGSCHVATIRTKGRGDAVYTSHLLRRSYRDPQGKVRHENLGNLSHLPDEIIDAIRGMLTGRRLVDLDRDFEIRRSLPHGHVAAVLGVLRDLDLERLLGRERCRERDLVVAMIVQRVIAPGSKLSATRRFAQSTLSEELGLGEVSEAELLAAMDWLLGRQTRIETTLARRHLHAGNGDDGQDAFVFYDLSSSYLEGRKCPLGKLGYSRDGVKGKLQVNYGLICSPDGRPVAVAVHPGSAQDQTTVPDAISAVTERFGVDRVVFVGDRGMITQAHAQDMIGQGVDFISALKAPQIKALVAAGDLQLSLFDQVNLAEITSERFPGERLMVCRNPAVAAQRARKRVELLTATETELDKILASTTSPRGGLRDAAAATIGQRAGKVINKYKMAKHFTVQITDGTFAYQRKTEQITAEAALDGFYIIRTTCTPKQISAPAAVRAYKQLKVNELAFKTMKDSLEIRPVYHHLEDRVRAHIFLCMLAYYLTYELTQRLTSMLFTDDTPISHVDPVSPARRSPQGHANATTAQTTHGHPGHTLPDLLTDLATLTRNTIAIHDGASFTRLTTPTSLQATALKLLNTTLTK
jgi:hypothetical protein